MHCVAVQALNLPIVVKLMNTHEVTCAVSRHLLSSGE